MPREEEDYVSGTLMIQGIEYRCRTWRTGQYAGKTAVYAPVQVHHDGTVHEIWVEESDARERLAFLDPTLRGALETLLEGITQGFGLETDTAARLVSSVIRTLGPPLLPRASDDRQSAYLALLQLAPLVKEAAITGCDFTWQEGRSPTLNIVTLEPEVPDLNEAATRARREPLPLAIRGAEVRVEEAPRRRAEPVPETPREAEAEVPAQPAEPPPRGRG